MEVTRSPKFLKYLEDLNIKSNSVKIENDENKYNKNYYSTRKETLFENPKLKKSMFSRKVFVGGLPPDIYEDEIIAAFECFGTVKCDWPHKSESNSCYPPKGYAFLVYDNEGNVEKLIEACSTEDNKLYYNVSSQTMKDKPVQIRPWRTEDADYILDLTTPLDPRKTVFVGGIPRPLKAIELALIMNRKFGSVCYAGIDMDPELKYPKGAGRVVFSNQESYISALQARFVLLETVEINKRVEIKPFVFNNVFCDECQGLNSDGSVATLFCIKCLRYYCNYCWRVIHSYAGFQYHRPLFRDVTDRPKPLKGYWY